jgi:hypothetical protein
MVHISSHLFSSLSYWGAFKVPNSAFFLIVLISSQPSFFSGKTARFANLSA